VCERCGEQQPPIAATRDRAKERAGHTDAERVQAGDLPRCSDAHMEIDRDCVEQPDEQERT
jgi:hypothetical protein